MNWPIVPLGEVAEFIRGVTYKPGDLTENFAEGSVVCMRTSNVQASLDESDMKSIPQHLVSSEKKMLEEGDLLVSTANSWNLVGKCCWVPKLSYKATAGGFIAILRAEETKIDKRYLYHWFSSPNTQVDARNCGRQTTNISNMDVGRCLQLTLPLPPLPEQRRIAAILDKADALRAKRREAIAKLDQLLQSVFLDMFGDPVTNPKGWPIHRFGDVTESRLGKMLDKRTSQGPHMKPYLANANVQWGRFELDSLRMMNFDPDDQLEFSLRTGDLLICEGGEPGRCAIWREDLKDCYYQKALHRVRCNPSYCVPEYLQRLFWLLSGSAMFDASVTTATIAHLPGIKLKALRIPLPPVALQKSFAMILDSVEKTADQHATSQRAVEGLFMSLQQQAFESTVAV